MTDIRLILALGALWIISALIIYGFLIIISYLINYRTGILFRLASFWIGIHYSKSCKRWCLNLIPCVTLYVTRHDGVLPNLKLI
jgi:ABC-type bacteriocin/lantibiotic exporter with double-glycine peptidase domain